MSTIPQEVFELPRSESNPSTCPRFKSCSAPICPLDVDWRSRTHLKSDIVCPYLREAVKPSGKAVLARTLLRHQAEGVLRVAPLIMASSVHVRRVLERAARSGSKIVAGQRLQDMRP
jgi:hypothetical protein